MARKAVGFHHGIGRWTSGNGMVNPAMNDIIVFFTIDEPGDYLIAYSAAATAPVTLDIIWVDSDGSTTLQGQRRIFGPGNDDLLFGNKITMALNQSIAVRMVAGFVGLIQASLFWFEVDEAGLDNAT